VTATTNDPRAAEYRAAGGFASSISTTIARHPEWWTVGLCLVAWSALIAGNMGSSGGGVFCGSLHRATALDGPVWTAGLGEWSLMVAAMMLPLVIAPVRRAARASLWRRRHRAIAEFLVGYGLIWTLFGGAALVILALYQPTPPWAPVAVFAIAALWELSPAKRRALSLCHRTIPLRPTGWRADFDCLRYGALQGRSCCSSCWVMMLGSTLTPQPLLAMAGIAGLCAVQRYRPRRRQYFEALALGAGALACAIAALA
jgi:hypothetical protein